MLRACQFCGDEIDAKGRQLFCPPSEDNPRGCYRTKLKLRRRVAPLPFRLCVICNAVYESPRPHKLTCSETCSAENKRRTTRDYMRRVARERNPLALHAPGFHLRQCTCCFQWFSTTSGRTRCSAECDALAHAVYRRRYRERQRAAALPDVRTPVIGELLPDASEGERVAAASVPVGA